MAARGSTSRQAPASSDAGTWTWLLGLSLIAQIVGVTFFYLDWSSYPTAKPAVPAMPTIAAGTPSAPAPGPGPGAGGGNP